MKIAKKSLSIFLAFLMLFSACSVGLTGITAFAAAEDSDYTADEVVALINAATANGFSISSSGNAWNYAADDGTALAAAEAIFDYALNAYREGKETTSKGNSTKALYDYFTAEFSSMYANAAAADRLVKNVLDPDGTAITKYEAPAKKSTKLGETKDAYTKGADVSANFPYDSYSSYYATGVATGTTTKTVDISLDINKYLMTFAKIEDIPSTVITNVKYTYAHGLGTSATVSNVTTRTAEEKDGCDTVTVTYYTPTIETSAFNYMASKPTRTVVKDKTIRKGLLLLEKYFTEERLAMTKDEMLAMDVEDIKSLFLTTEEMYKSMENYTDAVLTHFGFAPAAIHQFMDDVDFAYRAVAAKYNIDNLNTLIGTEYNVESYAEMSALYAKTSTAYNVVFNLDADIIAYLEGEGNYSEQYASALALKTAAESYNATLYDIMTEQKLEETVAAMVATYSEYINVLNKEDIEKPTDAEVIGLVQKVEAFDAIIASYTGYSYYRTYWTAEYESEWARFSGILDEVYEVRGLKMEFETYYDYFLPLIYTTYIDDLDNGAAISLHAELDTKLGELRDSYNSVVSKWGGTIADKIFTVVYEDSPYLLQTLVDSVKSAGKEAVKTVLIARTEAQLDAVYAYKDTTVVNFDNFASIKSTLTYFDYDLYNYVNGGEEGQNKWLSTDYTNKYSMVQTLLDRYHAFSTSDGKSYFNESFTFADANGNYAVRYAGNQLDAEGNQIGYPNDIARDGADDNYVVTEETLLNTVAKIDSFITSRDFGAIIGLVSTETEEYCDLGTYVTELLNEMLYTDNLINTLVGAIYPMVVDLLNTELVGMLADMGENDNANASACIDLEAMEVKNASGHLYVYMDDDLYNGKEHLQRNLDEVLADAGLYVYPQTLADSLMMSNPIAYGKGTPIYTALKAAGRDWTQLVCSDDPETEQVDETKVLEFEWGVYDAETFVDTLGCIFDSLLPLLNAVLTGTNFNETLNNAAYVYSSDVKYSIISAGKIAAYGHLNLSIPGLTVYNDVLIPLFEILGVEKIPSLKSGASGDDIAKAIVEPLLSVLDEVLLGKNPKPLTTILEILPNLVYFLSMDSVQEILNSLNIALNLKIEAEIDKDKSGTLADLLGGTLVDLLGDNLAFDVNLAIADMINLYDMLGFEISDFNEVLKFATASMGLNLPPIKQQEIIFCSDWGTSPTGRVYLHANEGDLMYWFLNYAVGALVPDENGNSLLTSLLGSDMDPMISTIIEQVVYKFTTNPRGALAALIELLNPAEDGYDLAEMTWLESQFDYNEIEGADQMSIVYLNCGNNWNRENAEYIVDNVDEIIDAVVALTGGEEINLGETIKGLVNGLFTNANITALVEMLGGLGDSPSAIIADIVGEQVGIKLDTWFTAFGYLFPAETWAEDAEIIPLGHRNYVNDFGVEGVANEDGTITWSFNKMPLVDGDGYTFVNILTRLLGGADVLVEFLFAGGDVSAFDGLLTLKGYETYATSLGLIFEMLGVQNLPTQADFNADAMGSFANMLYAVLDWFYTLVESEDMISQIIELIPTLFYFVESNGLSTILRNLLQPVWVLVDTIRPLVDVDLNGVLSLVVSDFINYGALDLNTIVDYVFTGIYVNDDLEYEWVAVDLFNLTFTEIIKIADAYIGTNLYESGLVQVGIKGFCSGLEEATTASGATIMRPTIDAADTVTILVSSVLDCLEAPAKDATMKNGDAIFALIAELAENEALADLYPAISEIITGAVEYSYMDLDWAYMFNEGDIFTPGELPEQSIVYLGYNTDWTKEAADGVYGALDSILDMILPSVLEENETLGTLIDGLLNDSVYSDANLTAIVELLVNAIVALDETLLELVGRVLTADIGAWFDMCELDEETGKFVCTKNWGVDAAAEADKKGIFVDGIKEVLEPANAVLSWLFFGTEYAFFTSADETDLLVIKGGEGYAYGIVPLLEALGCTVPAAETFENADGTYNVGNAVAAIFDSVLALADVIAADPVKEVFNLLPNLIYFINAGGAKVVVNNLIAPVNTILEKVSAFAGEISLGGLLVDAIGFDITAIDMATIATLLADAGVVVSPEMADILCNLYVGQLTEFTSANGRTAYRLDVTGREGDILTILLSFAIDLFKLSDDLFGGLLGAENYASIITLLGGLDFEKNYLDMNWAYMYDGDLDKLNNAGFPEQTITYLNYNTDWDEATAAAVYGALDDIIALVLPSLLGDNEDIAGLVNGLLNDSVYTDANLNTIVEALVGLLVGLDSALYEGVGGLLSADIDAWFDMCDITTDANGETVVTCNVNWGVDAAADKKAAFVDGIKEVLAPAEKVLNWLFLGGQYELLEGTTGDVLVTLNGGQGYAYGLVPIFEALGCTMAPASELETAGDAVEAILNGALTLVDKISDSENPVEEILVLLPNLFYFINAGGLKASVNNLLAPVNAVLDCLSGLVGEVSIGSLLVDAIGFDICDMDMDTVLALVADFGFVVTDEMAYVLKNLYVGTPVAYTSATGRTAYHVAYNEGNPAHEMLTILLSFALEAFTINDTLFADLLGEDTYWAVRNLIKGATDEFEYLDLNWGYMYEGATNAEKLAALQAVNGVLPERTNAAYDVYTTYQNNWNKQTADYVTLVLDKLVHEITTAARSDGSSLGQILDEAIADGLYQDSLLNDLVSMVVELMLDYEDIVKGAGALLGAEELADWFTYCDITEDENGNKVVTCTKDWGIDAAETIDEKRTAFINAFATVLEPTYDLLAWLFFAQDYTFFSATTGEPLITLKGGKGYEEAFIPLFEAVGVLMKRDANGELLSVEDTYLKGESAVLPASYFYTADGELDMKLAVTTIFGAVSDWLYDICGNLGKQSTDGVITSMLERLPNVLYSVNADGLVAVVNNLTAPLLYLLDCLQPMGVEIDFNELIGIEGMDIFNFQFDDLFALLADEDVLGLYFPDYTQDFIKTFYIGELKSYRSANGSDAYFMTYSDTETEAEMITCLIGFVVDALKDPRNETILIDWFGEDVFKGIMAVLGLQGVKEMNEFEWLYTEYADTDYAFNAIESSVRYDIAYNTIWTRDKAEYIGNNLPGFVNSILGLIGLELEGYEVKDVDDLMDALLNGMLYTTDTVNALLDLVRDLVSNIDKLEPYGAYISDILNTAFDVNLKAWDTMTFNFADGDKDAFVAALGEIIAPIVPLLNVLLCGENIELFYTIEPENVGESALIIYGSEGYAYGIVPLFEALGCEMMDPTSFKALSNEAKASAIINSLVNRIEVIADDPINEIFAMIPELVYFVNSKGLATSVNNILNSVDTVLMALEPILGATSLMELVGFDLGEMDMNSILEMACEAIADSTGLECEALLVDVVAELTMGKVVSYTSANGETYYKMVYANEGQYADMVTVVLRLLVDFLATGENADAIIALIANNSESEDAANSASTLINFILTAANTEPVTSGAMAVIYYLFYGLNNGIVGIDTLYGNYGKTWDSLVGFFQESDDSYYTKAADVLKNLLAEIGGVDTGSSVPVCDCDCHNNSSFIRFFHKIITFLRKLFGMKEFQTCDCGTAHW